MGSEGLFSSLRRKSRPSARLDSISFAVREMESGLAAEEQRKTDSSGYRPRCCV